MRLDAADPLAVATTDAIRGGDVAGLRRLLAAHPELATARIADGTAERTLLHVVADWPGHHPHGAGTVAVLVAAGADAGARLIGPNRETPLHWAASCDDVAVLDALLDAGADIDAPGGVVGDGTPLADARAFRQWRTAHRLVERGAHVTLQDAATLGMTAAVADLLGDAGPEDVSAAFWNACHGGRRETAAYLLAHGADPHWVAPWEPMTPLDAALRSGAGDVVAWLRATVSGTP